MGRSLHLKSTRKSGKAAREPNDSQTHPGETLAERIQRLHAISEQIKTLEREAEALKGWFRCEAKGEDVTFEYLDLIVGVMSKSRTTLDRDKLTLSLGESIKQFEKTTSYTEVSVRKKRSDL